MENKLLTLWRYYPSGSIRVEELSETLQLSHKQTTRYLKKWNEEGWIAFTPGRGRGKCINTEMEERCGRNVRRRSR